jgi:two-component system, OmpR family, KDP operon response regulator KdpE
MNRNVKVLVIDDDVRIQRFLQLNLEAEGNYTVLAATSGRVGFETLLTEQPDVLILDLMLPDTDGLELCERVREFSDIPIIILTARTEQAQLVQGLNLGADDYIAKPFSREELLARLRAVLRRVGFSESVKRSPDIERGGIVLSCRERKLMHPGKSVKLSHTEFKLLYFLMANANRLLTSDDLIARVWGTELVGNTDSLRTYIRYLRQKIEADPQNPTRIVTERGIGYMFVDAGGAS